jgi:hypothetical protein
LRLQLAKVQQFKELSLRGSGAATLASGYPDGQCGRGNLVTRAKIATARASPAHELVLKTCAKRFRHSRLRGNDETVTLTSFIETL